MLHFPQLRGSPVRFTHAPPQSISPAEQPPPVPVLDEVVEAADDVDDAVEVSLELDVAPPAPPSLKSSRPSTAAQLEEATQTVTSMP
jgi:hypothetical protein